VSFKAGDIVARNSYNADIFFKIVDLFTGDDGKPRAKLKALDVRLYADAPVSDLIKADENQIKEYRQRFIRINNEHYRRILSRRTTPATVLKRLNSKPQGDSDRDFFDLPGRVLHIDGNQEYLKLCMPVYHLLSIPARGIYVPEAKQPEAVPVLLRRDNPDILVLTGHDGLIKDRRDYDDLESYHHSKYFVEGVKQARKYERNKDELIIFAGACQSHYEAIIEAGANFASAPLRSFIHAFDPVFIVEKLAFASIYDAVAVHDVIENAITGTEGLGGIETRGKLRKGFPLTQFLSP